jgi:hypothetical protein
MFDTLDSAQEKLIEQLAELLRLDADPRKSIQGGAIEDAADRIYHKLGLPSPYVIWCDGPFELLVMPVLLQLLTFSPTKRMREELIRKHGLRKFNAREDELAAVLKQPRWARCLKVLLNQVSTDVLADLGDTEKKSDGDHQNKQFPWSALGDSTAEPICRLLRDSCTEASQLLAKAATLRLSTELTSRLYTTPIDRSQRIKQTIAHILARDESIRLTDNAATVFGAARGPLTGLYKKATELHKQTEGTIFEDILRLCPAPQPAPEYKGARNLPEDDLTINTAGILAFGPYQTLWGAWGSVSATCYSIIAGMFRDQFPNELRILLQDLSIFLRSGFAYTPLTRAVFLCRFPSVIVDEHQRLHSTTGAALEFEDGWKLFALQGVPAPADLIYEPHLLTAKRIESERNVALRRVMIEIYGLGKYIQEIESGIVDRNERGVLYLKQQPGDEAMAIVQVTNSTPEPDGTYKDYFLRVPPSMRTVDQAIAWTFGMTPNEYKPEVET